MVIDLCLEAPLDITAICYVYSTEEIENMQMVLELNGTKSSVSGQHLHNIAYQHFVPPHKILFKNCSLSICNRFKVV